MPFRAYPSRLRRPNPSVKSCMHCPSRKLLKKPTHRPVCGIPCRCISTLFEMGKNLWTLCPHACPPMASSRTVLSRHSHLECLKFGQTIAHMVYFLSCVVVLSKATQNAPYFSTEPGLKSVKTLVSTCLCCAAGTMRPAFACRALQRQMKGPAQPRQEAQKLPQPQPKHWRGAYHGCALPCRRCLEYYLKSCAITRPAPRQIVVLSAILESLLSLVE